MTTYDTLQSGTATVSGSPSFDDGPWTVHGVAQASEVTQGVSGERRFWPPDTLRDAAELLIGTPVVSPEEHDDLTPGQPDPTTIIGEVTDAAYDDAREALVYEAELDDPEFAKLAARGRIDVSPSVQLRDGELDPERDATRVDEVLGYRDLAAVTEGAHASASLNLGMAEALARQFDVAVDALQRDRARTPTYSGTEETEWNTPTLDEYLAGYDSLPDDADSVDDLTRDQRSLIARKSLLGTAAGETLREVRFFPVVDPATDNLNRRALGAVRSGRGAQADIPDDARASAQRIAGELLVEEFGSDIAVESMADVADVSNGTLVRWNSSGDRPAYGMVNDVRTEGDEQLEDEIDGDQTITPPAALIEVHQPTADDGGWEPSGTMVGHTLNSDTLTVVDSLPSPDSLASYRDSDDGQTDVGQSTPVLTDDTTTMSDLSDKEQELLAAARQKDDPTVVEAGVPERLNDNAALLDDAESTEDPVIVESTEFESLQDRLDTVEGVFAEALAEDTDLNDAAIEAMSFEAMAAHFEDEDGDLDVEALTQSPETGSGPTDEPNDSLSAAEEREVKEHRNAIEALAGKGGVAKHERQRRADCVAELTGEDPDTILNETED